MEKVTMYNVLLWDISGCEETINKDALGPRSLDVRITTWNFLRVNQIYLLFKKLARQTQLVKLCVASTWHANYQDLFSASDDRVGYMHKS